MLQRYYYNPLDTLISTETMHIMLGDANLI